MIKDYPDFLKKYKLNPSDEVIDKHIGVVIDNSAEEYKEELEKYWRKYEDRILFALSKITGVSMNTRITFYIRNIHWYQRNLDKKSLHYVRKILYP